MKILGWPKSYRKPRTNFWANPIEKIKVIRRIRTLIQETKGKKPDGIVKENTVGADNGASLRHIASLF